jgi:hypothetical protein
MNDAPFYYEYTDDFSESKRGDYDAPCIFTEIKKGEIIANYNRPRYWDNYFNRLEDKKAIQFKLSTGDGKYLKFIFNNGHFEELNPYQYINEFHKFPTY